MSDNNDNNAHNPELNNYNQEINKENEIKKEENKKPILSLSSILHNFDLSNKDSNDPYSKEKREELAKKRLEEEKEKNAIRDKLKCFICFGKLVNATMCPHCKKLACEQCIKTVLEKCSVCSNCKNILLIDELIKIPMLNDFTSFFINNIEQKDENDKDDANKIAELKKKKCEEHPNKNIEYFCMNCNQYLCSLSLLFFNKLSVDKHKNHIIFSLDDIEKFSLYKIINEYMGLKENKKNLDNKINVYQKNINGIKYKKDIIKKSFGTLKSELKAKYENKINKIKLLLNKINTQKKNVTNMLEKPPNLIFDLNNEEKSKQFLEELKNLNNLDVSENNIETIANFKKMIKFEQFESEYLEIELPNNGKYIDEYKVIDKELYFIPGTKCKLNCQMFMNKIFFNLSLEINNQLFDEYSMKYICFLSIETGNERHGILPECAKANNELIFSSIFHFTVIKNMINKNGECYCKFYISKFYYK